MTTRTHAPTEGPDTDPAVAAPASRKVVSGGALLTATMAISGAGNYAVNALLARWLTPAEFGDASLIVTLLLVVTALAGCFQLVAARFASTAVASADNDAVMALRLRLARAAWFAGGLIGLGMALAADGLAHLFNVESTVALIVFAAGIPLFLAQAVERGILQGRLAFGGLALTFLVEMVVRVVVSCVLVATGWGVVGVSAALWLSLLASFALARTIVAPTKPQRAVPRTAGLRHAAGATTALLVAQIAIGHGDLLLVKQRFSAVEAGTYAVVALLGRAVFLASWSAVTAAFPVGARAGTHGREMRRVVRGGVALLATGGAVATVGFWALGETVVRTLFSDDYAAAGALLGPYVLATSLLGVANFLAMVDLAAGRHRRSRLMMAAAVCQSLLVAASPSLQAVVWAQVATMAVMTATMLYWPEAGRTRRQAWLTERTGRFRRRLRATASRRERRPSLELRPTRRGARRRDR